MRGWYACEVMEIVHGQEEGTKMTVGFWTCL